MNAKSKWLEEDGNIIAPNTLDSCVFGSDGKSLKEKLPFEFGIDENGKYGYFKINEETVTPFGTGDGGNLVIFDQNYSTEEQLTSKRWVDGKPIYQKTYNIVNGVILTIEWKQIIQISDDIETLIASEIYDPNYVMDMYLIRYKDGYLQGFAPINTLGINAGSRITILYTKTTDTADSPVDIPVVDKLPFKFGIDENGNYGYYKVGADTVTPFKSGMSDNQIVISGYPDWSNTGSSSPSGSIVYAPDREEYPGYGRAAWWTTDNLINAYNAYHFYNPVKVTRARIALGVSTENTWTREGTLSIQASNDGFSKEAVTLATVTLSYDQDLLSKGLYGVFWEGDIDNDQFYKSYRVICTNSSGFTGVNKLQLSCIRYFGEAQI